MDLRNVLPTAAVVGFEKGREADVIYYPLPVDGELEVPERFAGDVLDITLLRKQNRLRDRDTDLVR